MRFRKLAVAFLAMLIFASYSKTTAQEKTPEKSATAATPTANPKDVESMDAIIAALYNVISGPAGERDWNRLRSLFLPDARLTAVHKKSDGSFSATSVTVEGYIERAGKYFREKPFYESELLRRVEKFGRKRTFSARMNRAKRRMQNRLRGESTVFSFSTTASAGIA